TFRELEAFTCSRLAVFLTFLHSRIASEESSPFQSLSQFSAVVTKCTGDAVLNSTCLTAHTAACNINNDIEFPSRLRNVERLLRHHSVNRIEEVLFDRLFVDGHLSRSRTQKHAGG